MKAIIPIAGKGTRTYPLSFAIPKPLLRIKGKPTLYYVTKVLKKFNVREVIYVISRNMVEFIEDIKKIGEFNSDYAIQEIPLGLGDAILCAEDKIEKGNCVIVLGDSIIDVNLKNFDKNKNYIGVYEVSDPRRFGVVTLKKNKIIYVEEKPQRPKTNLIICGIYYISEIEKLFSALKEIKRGNIKTRGEYQLTDALQILLREKVDFYPLKVKRWFDTGTLYEILETHKKILSKNLISKKAIIKNTKIKFPLWIDDDTIIEDSEIGPFVSIERGCEIKKSKIQDAIIYKGSKIIESEIQKGIIGDESEIKSLKVKEIFVTNKSKVIF